MEKRISENFIKRFIKEEINKENFIIAIKETNTNIEKITSDNIEEIVEYWDTALYIKYHAENRGRFRIPDDEFFDLFKWIENQQIFTIMSEERKTLTEEVYKYLLSLREKEPAGFGGYLAYRVENDEIIDLLSIEKRTCPLLLYILSEFFVLENQSKIFFVPGEVEEIYGEIIDYCDDEEEVIGIVNDNNNLKLLPLENTKNFIRDIFDPDFHEERITFFSDSTMWEEIIEPVNYKASDEEIEMFNKCSIEMCWVNSINEVYGKLSLQAFLKKLFTYRPNATFNEILKLWKIILRYSYVDYGMVRVTKEEFLECMSFVYGVVENDIRVRDIPLVLRAYELIKNENTNNSSVILTHVYKQGEETPFYTARMEDTTCPIEFMFMARNFAYNDKTYLLFQPIHYGAKEIEREIKGFINIGQKIRNVEKEEAENVFEEAEAKAREWRRKNL